MESNRTPASERRRAAEVAALRRRTISVAVGAIGLILLFGGAIGSLLFSSIGDWPFIGLEIFGLGLIVVSFARLRGPASGLLRAPEK